MLVMVIMMMIMMIKITRTAATATATAAATTTTTTLMRHLNFHDVEDSNDVFCVVIPCSDVVGCLHVTS
jgi:hypothetical protein